MEPAVAQLQLQQSNQKNISRCGTCCGTVQASAKQPRVHLAAPWRCREETKKAWHTFCRIAGQPPSYFLHCAAWPFGRPGLFLSGSRLQVQIQFTLQSGNEVNVRALCALHKRAARAETFARVCLGSVQLGKIRAGHDAFHDDAVHREVRFEHSQVQSLLARVIILGGIDAGLLQSPLSFRFGHEEHVNKRASCGLLHHCLCWVLLVRSLTAHHPEGCSSM